MHKTHWDARWRAFALGFDIDGLGVAIFVGPLRVVFFWKAMKWGGSTSLEK